MVIPGSVTDENPRGKFDNRESVSAIKIYRTYATWFEDNLPGHKVPIRNTVIDELTRRWGPLHDGRWYGIKLRSMRAIFN